MAHAIPRTTKQWKVAGVEGIKSLEFSEQPIPQLGDSQVLVKSTFQHDHTFLEGQAPCKMYQLTNHYL